MKRIFRLLTVSLLLFGIFSAYILFSPLAVSNEKKYFIVKTGSNFKNVQSEIVNQQILSSTFYFDIICKLINYPGKIKPGRYEITQSTNLFGLIRKLKSGQQKEVRLVINKLRTKEDLAGKIGRQFEADSLEAIHFICNNDSLKKYQIDTNTMMCLVIPNSYLFWWNGSIDKIIYRLKSQHDLFWEGKRTEKAKKLGLSTNEVYTLASIVEEETNADADKGKVASVYLNRLKKDMRLEADPTVKYALRNFELKRVLHGHLTYPSPYNTYLNKGLPPGPICTPSISTIDAVLNAPTTDFLFFVAKPDLNGLSNFSADYNTHLKYAKLYQDALDKLYGKTSD